MIQLYKKEIILALLILAFKIILLSLIPLTGDEAYFIKWGNNIDLGFYDHPPMVGWLIYLMSYVSESYIFYRLFSVVATLIVALVIYKIAELYIEKQKAFFVALLFLLSPIDILITLFTNDVPLLLFSSLGTLFLLYSFEKKKSLLYSVLAGIFLGLAFLSKYFVVFLMFSLLIFSFIKYGVKAIKNVIIITLVLSIFILENLYFNYNCCWNNIMFNFFARTETSSFSIGTIIGYFALIIYFITPWGLYFLYKSKENFRSSTLLKLLTSILVVSFTVFFLVSLKNKIGLHWFFLFVPYIFLLFSFVNEKYIGKLLKYSAIFTFTHILLLLTLLLIPKSYFEDHKKYSDIVLFTDPQKICSKLSDFEDKDIFTFGYTTASVLSYHCDKDIKMLFNNSKYGRLDDKLLDVRTLENQDIYLLDKKTIDEEKLNKVCTSVTVQTLNITNADYFIAKCNNFNYEKYKENYLDVQKEKFYNIPSWLPVGECYFNERYYR